MKSETVEKKQNRFVTWLKKDWHETRVLFKCLPAIPFAILCVTLIVMNFLANKGVDFGGIFGQKAGDAISKFFSADSAIFISWIGFLAGDMMVKCFGTKAAIKVNLAAIGIQLIAISMFSIGAAIPGSYENSAGDATAAFNELFLAQFWPCFGGTMAFALATIIDSILSGFLLKLFKNRTSFKAYAVASYVSTGLGQFIDNMFFGLFFSMWQGWFAGGAANTFGQIALHLLGFSAIGMVVELIGQAILSPVGFKLTNSWRKKGVGAEYIALVEDAQEVNKTDAVIEKTRPSILKILLFIGSAISIVGSIVLAIFTRINLCNAFEYEVGGGYWGLELSGLANGMIAVVYILAFVGFALYVAGAFIKNKKVAVSEAK
ncbi:MAG: VUT family protein [Acetobacter sp.]|nr:VUT family protein [Acetobacter sp.]